MRAAFDFVNDNYLTIKKQRFIAAFLNLYGYKVYYSVTIFIVFKICFSELKTSNK